MNHTRRRWLTTMSLAGAGTLIAACKRQANETPAARNQDDKSDESTAQKEKDENSGGEVTATEDLMREHGVLRRALLVFEESAMKLHESATAVDPAALEKTAQLFRAFGEEYHEKKLEETYIFPTVKKAAGAGSAYTDVLLAQHARGREITDYILSVTSGDKIPSANLSSFIKALESFVRMYEHHAAVEDTIVFPAWKAVIGDDELAELGERFEQIEQQQFGEDGFEDAVKRIGDIEESLGLAKLELFTASPPPTAPAK
ncbi:MAG: hemerythrin domain-containing protein [Pyrinomonadaceae bacterium]